MTHTVIDNENLGYGPVAVLPQLTFAYRDGERIAILGRSGSGKTTLLSTVYRRLAQYRSSVALIPQDMGLVPQLSVFHNVYMGRLDRHHTICNLINWVSPRDKHIKLVMPILELVGLQELLRVPVDELSGGEKQRVALARALYRGGEILLGDEPVSSVDESQARALLDHIRSQFRTAIVALHDTDVARQFATRIVGLKSGHVAIDAEPQVITRQQLEGLYGQA